MMESKRDFLKKISLLTAGGLMAGSVAPVLAATKSVPTVAGKKMIGLQIYSLMNELTVDVPAGMKKIKEIGYSTIELPVTVTEKWVNTKWASIENC